MSRLRRSLAFGIVIATLAGSALAREPREGLVVIEAPSMSSLARAGLQPGDVLLSWQRSGSSGALRWPSGLAEAETEQAPWGVVRLSGWRGDRPMTWQMPAVRWNVRTRPALSPHLLSLYQEGAERATGHDLAGAADAWLRAADAAARMDDKQRAAWFLGELGHVQATASQWEAADQAYEDAIRRVEGSGMAAYLLREWGGTFVQRELWASAESCYQRALALAPRGSLAAGRDLALLASIATHQGDLERAETLYEQALATRRRITAPGTYLTQMTREEIAGFGIPDRGVDREEIEDLRHKLEGLREKLLALAGVPPTKGSEGSARTAAAPPKKPEQSPLETLQKALTKAELEATGRLEVSDRWQEVGAHFWTTGNPAMAEAAWLHALELREKLAPGTLREARTLHDLGRTHAKAQRNRAAASFFCRAAGALDRMDRTPPDDARTRDALGAAPATYDQDCVAALVEAEHPEEAFEALERNRVRDGALPLAPELARRRKDLDADRARALERLGRLSTSRDRDEVDLLIDYAEELESRRSALGNTAGPRDLDALRSALAPGTLLLAWSIGNERSFLFLVRPGEAPGPGVEVFPIGVRAADLRERVPAFSRHVGPAREEAAGLYRQLFGPADEQIARAERLLLLPGKTLKPLPFGELVQKPLETATSVTAWAAAKDPKDLKAAKDNESP